jgi:hypothetical protein
MSDNCQRCNEESEDNRTLWMACLYQMGELGLPFEEVAVRGRYCQQVGDDSLNFETHPEASEHLYRFYTLRVCKRCRADWMSAIRNWFQDAPEPEEDEEDEEDGGIYVRRLGSTERITQEEWDARQKGGP